MIPITNMLISNKRKRPFKKLKKISAIIIHWTANTNKGANAIANRNYFQNDHKDKKTGKLIPPSSAHFNVDDLRIIQCLPDDEVGYHVGAVWSKFKTDAHRLMGTNPTINRTATDTPNNYTIGIEMCVNSDADPLKVWQNTVELTQFLMLKHKISIENVLRHYDITGKDCPKMMVGEKESEWTRFKNEVSNEIEIRINQPITRNVEVDDNLNIRNAPSKTAQIVGTLADGELVTVYNTEGTWSNIGDNRWVHSKFLI